MNEDFKGHGQMPGLQLPLQALKIRQRELSGQNDPFTAQCGRLRHTSSTRDRHLRGAMQRKIRHQGSSQTTKTHVLNDQRIHSGGLRRKQQRSSSFQLIAEHEHVEGEETPHLALMQPGHHLPQFFDAEVLSPLAGIESIDTEINGIGTVGDCGLEAVPVTGWGEQLRNGQGRREVKRRAASN